MFCVPIAGDELGALTHDFRQNGFAISVNGCCGFRAKAGRIPKSSRSAFRNEAGHDSGLKPVTDSDFKPVTFGRLSEP